MRTGNRRPETEESERNEMIISDISSEETKMQTEGIESCGLFANGGKSCRLCPLECGVNRAEHAGVCGVGRIPDSLTTVFHTAAEIGRASCRERV